MNESSNIRTTASQILAAVIDQGRSLSQVLPAAETDSPQDKARLQEICYGSLRHLRQLQFFTSKLIEKPLKKQYRNIELLVYTGLYQLAFMRIAEHAVVAETVDAAQQINPAMKGLVNGVLRSFIRRKEELQQQLKQHPQIELSFPNWLYQAVESAYPEQYLQILNASNQYPPMWLRVNQQQYTAAEYLEQLQQHKIQGELSGEAQHGILLEKPTAVEKLPQFEQGSSSVQDAAAQLSVNYLQLQAGQRVLDCCCAPGGKTCHILEAEPQLEQVWAIDSDESRLPRVEQNLARLGLEAKLLVGDASQPEQWWDGEQFDRILLDAPCSATGVIRRHPDIKWLRKKTDIAKLVELQQSILTAIWPLLRVGGRLVYATCSILPEENQQQMQTFLQQTPDAELADGAEATGRQIIPGEHGMDGFYYAALIKTQ